MICSVFIWAELAPRPRMGAFIDSHQARRVHTGVAPRSKQRKLGGLGPLFTTIYQTLQHTRRGHSVRPLSFVPGRTGPGYCGGLMKPFGGFCLYIF